MPDYYAKRPAAVRHACDYRSIAPQWENYLPPGPRLSQSPWSGILAPGMYPAREQKSRQGDSEDQDYREQGERTQDGGIVLLHRARLFGIAAVSLVGVGSPDKVKINGEHDDNQQQAPLINRKVNKQPSRSGAINIKMSPSSMRSLPPRRWVLSQARSLESVQGVRMPAMKLLRILPR